MNISKTGNNNKPMATKEYLQIALYVNTLSIQMSSTTLRSPWPRSLESLLIDRGRL